MNLRAHIMITLAALGDGDAMSREALRQVLLANCLTDLGQDKPAWHFDNAPDRATICDLWRRGLHAHLEEAVAFCEPCGPRMTRLRSRWRALRAFGRATHTLQDFYAHTNWVELHARQTEVTAPLLGEQCLAADLPLGLQSGYFSLRYALPQHRFSGCPVVDGELRPPAGFGYCHEQLAKDHPDRGRGALRLWQDGPTHFELAAALAVRSTKLAWQALLTRIHSRYARHPALAPGRVVTKLAWGSDDSCLSDR